MIPRGRYTPGQEPQCLCEFDASNQWGLWTDDARTTRVTSPSQQIAVLDDRTGNGRHARQTSATRRPTYTITSGNPGVTFDGVDDSLRVNAFAWGNIQKYELWCVCTPTAFVANYGILAQLDTSYTNTDAVLMYMRYNSLSMYRYSPRTERGTGGIGAGIHLCRGTVDTTIDGSAQSEVVPYVDGYVGTALFSKADSTYAVGTRAFEISPATIPFTGIIHHVAVFSGLLDAATTSRVSRFFKSKWGTP